MNEPRPTCPGCRGPIDAAGRFCPACGTALTSSSTAPTLASPPALEPTPGSGAAASSASIGHAGRVLSGSTGGARFSAGDVLAGRYRVIGLLGRGGMGEVYRADDLTLDQSVALKFLPPAFASEPDRRARFLGEVRTARQVTHPNVCRVHDVGEIEGLLYLSMEYVDGEDLSSLLRRIGRLSGDKAIEIARQLCAGLAAAHDRGVLHRDLKPANVMIDGEGKVRLTDFGLAGAVRDIEGAEVRAGTPAYMSPEQLTGKEVSERSDIYALGLVLYELLTGHRPFRGGTLGELTDLHTTRTPRSPSTFVPSIDPSIETVVLRCLEKDPSRRPGSALAVSAALPGGDPLAAALAAGETPSPELVAAAGATSAIRPIVAWPLFLAFGATLITLAALNSRAQLFGFVPGDVPAAVRAAKAREILADLGHGERSADTDQGFDVDGQIINEIVASGDATPDYWRPVIERKPSPLSYWYRQSPRSLFTDDPDGIVRYSDPPLDLAGMARLRFDMPGRLLELTIVPPQVAESPKREDRVEWSRLFAYAGLDPERFDEIEPVWLPMFYADEVRSWRGTYEDEPGDTVRIDAAGVAGRPYYFEVIGDWQEPLRQVSGRTAGEFRFTRALSLGIILSIILVGGALARRNLVLGRGDPRGAFRLAGAVAVCGAVGWVLSADHPADFGHLVQGLFLAVGFNLFVSALVWLVYVALEPHLRRRWPHRIVTWSRVLAGRLRDPKVGRDVLIGALVGVFSAFIDALHVLVPPILGVGGRLPIGTPLRSLLGVDETLAIMLASVGQGVINGLVFILGPLVFYLIVRREILGVVIFGLVILGLWVGRSPVLWIALSVGVIQSGLWLTLMMRGGLLPLTVTFVVYFATTFAPISLRFSAFYGGASMAAIAAIGAIGTYGFLTAIKGRPLLGAGALDQASP